MATTKKTTTTTKKTSKTSTPSNVFKTLTHKEHKITKKRSGRYQVVDKNGKSVNGMDKARILVDAKLVQAGFPKDGSTPKAKTEAPPADEAPST